MRGNISKRIQSMALAMLLLGATLASLGSAQNQPAPKQGAGETQQMYVVDLVRVKLGMENEWQNLIKNEFVPALKKGGVSQMAVLRTATFGGAGEYIMFTRINSIAELDEPERVAAAGPLAEEFTRDVNDQEFDVSIQFVFTNKAAFEKYSKSEKHLKFIEENKPNWKKVRVFDSYLEQ